MGLEYPETFPTRIALSCVVSRQSNARGIRVRSNVFLSRARHVPRARLMGRRFGHGSLGKPCPDPENQSPKLDLRLGEFGNIHIDPVLRHPSA
jgi:hypothetical protein